MEQSESGAPIFRHKGRERDFEFAIGDSENIERISGHIEKYVGPVATVYHEMISDLVHIDIHIVEPTPERNFYTLVTSGMSDRAMKIPHGYEGCEGLQYSELLICLPPEWPMSQDSWKDEANYWPIRTLKMLARFPHEYQTWLWIMHTIPNGDPSEPYAPNTQMCGAIILPPVTLPDEFQELKIDDEKTIHFHAVVPLHSDEMELKLRAGTDALFDGFEKSGVSELLDAGRESSLGPKKEKGKKGWFSRWWK